PLRSARGLRSFPTRRSSDLVVRGAERRTAQPLIKRNPFDSETGPLDSKPAPIVEAPEPEPQVTDPLRAPVCSDVKVQIVTESERSEEHTSELQSREKHVCRL